MKRWISCWAWRLGELVRLHSALLYFGIKSDRGQWKLIEIDIIELGLPFTDPIADGPTIQKSNLRALDNGVTVSSMLQMVKGARAKGLQTPVLFMGYYNPIMRYGEAQLLRDCRDAGVSGFIIVDLPPEEAVRFRNSCASAGWVSLFLLFLFLGFIRQDDRADGFGRVKVILCSADRALNAQRPDEDALLYYGLVHLPGLKNGCHRRYGISEYGVARTHAEGEEFIWECPHRGRVWDQYP